MNIAITDDLKYDNDDLKKKIEQYSINNIDNISIEQFYEGSSFLTAFKENKYDIVFMDIYLIDSLGIDIARIIYERDKNCKIIFTTTSNSFASESYEVKAFSYIIKPITYEKISSLFASISPDKNYINFDLLGSKLSVKVEVDDILYIDIVTRIVHIHLKDQVLKIKGHLNDFTPMLLNSTSFIECFRGIIVNMKHISKFTDIDFLMDNGDIIPIRKRNSLDIKKKYLKYKLDKI